MSLFILLKRYWSVTLEKCLPCPSGFFNIYGYLNNPTSTMYNPYRCYVSLYTSAQVFNLITYPPSGCNPNANWINSYTRFYFYPLVFHFIFLALQIFY